MKHGTETEARFDVDISSPMEHPNVILQSVSDADSFKIEANTPQQCNKSCFPLCFK